MSSFIFCHISSFFYNFLAFFLPFSSYFLSFFFLPLNVLSFHTFFFFFFHPPFLTLTQPYICSSHIPLLLSDTPTRNGTSDCNNNCTPPPTPRVRQTTLTHYPCSCKARADVVGVILSPITTSGSVDKA